MLENRQKQTSPQERQSMEPTVSTYSLATITVTEKKVGVQLRWSDDGRELHVNTELFSNVDQARLTVIREISQRLGLLQAFSHDAMGLLNATKTHPQEMMQALRWQGLAKLRESGADHYVTATTFSQNQTYVDELDAAIECFLLTSKYPSVISDFVGEAIKKIPQPKGNNLVSLISSGRYLEFDGNNIRKYLQPIFDELENLDTATHKTAKFEYQPAQTEDLKQGSEELLDEKNIRTKVTPFYGGYYREHVCHYDHINHRIVQDSSPSLNWRADPNELEISRLPRRKYEGVFDLNSKTVLKLPYDAYPISHTLIPMNIFRLVRNNNGVMELILREGIALSQPKEFSFEFVLAKRHPNSLSTPPTNKDTKLAGGDLDSETEIFIGELSLLKNMSVVQKAREIVKYIHKKFRYPQDKNEISKIDSLYKDTGRDLWITMLKHGVAHCYWANILRNELCKRIGIASRIITGPYIKSKDPRFDFTVVEAKGVHKHAWGEIWDPLQKVWEQKGMDATPAIESDPSQEEKVTESEQLDGDFGQRFEEKPVLSAEEIGALYEKLIGAPLVVDTPRTEAAKLFEQREKVPYAKWKKFEEWIETINKTEISAEVSISGRKSNLYQEWRDLFTLLLKKREIPETVFKGPVRQSEGDYLIDPVTAFIDVRAGNDDPSGFQKTASRQEKVNEVSEFHDDYILDVSGSMKGLGSEEQQKMVMVTLLNIMNLNERLGNPQYARKMTTPLSISSRIAVFGNSSQVIKESEEPITKECLYRIHSQIAFKHDEGSVGLIIALENYLNSLSPVILEKIKKKEVTKVLSIISDGGIIEKGASLRVIQKLRELGVIVQGIGFGAEAQDIKVVCHQKDNPDCAVVIGDVTQATVTKHRLLMKHLSKL